VTRPGLRLLASSLDRPRLSPRTWLAWLAAVAILASLLACSPQETAPAPAPGAKWERVGFDIDRITDEEHGVVCYRGDFRTLACVRYAPMPIANLGTEPKVRR